VDAARYERLMDLFDQACDLSNEERAAVIAKTRETDPALATQLQDMLLHDAETLEVLEPAAGAHALAAELQRDGEFAPPMSTLDHPGVAGAAGRVGAHVGDYLVGECLGRGGSGMVYKALHQPSGTEVAIKFLHRRALNDERQIERFRREFKAVAALDHPGCLKVFEEGRGEHGRYFAMEYMPGGDLRRLVGRPTEVLLPALHTIADTLAYVHGWHIVHRDLKPENVLLSDDARPLPKLADFGIARVAGASIVTKTGTMVGSLDYVSPEQVRGGGADARSDLYALGCLIHKLFAGKPPFEGDNFERLYGRLKRAAPTLAVRAPAAPPALVGLTDRLMATDPADRPQTAAEVAQILSTIGTP
jgi:serine/threonine protein kinase